MQLTLEQGQINHLNQPKQGKDIVILNKSSIKQ